MKKGDLWGTPPRIFIPLNARFAFTLDGAANQDNHLSPRWYGPGGEREDALAEPWGANERIWCNPPYSRGMQLAFVERALEAQAIGTFTAMLLPADTSTKLYHQHIKHLPHEFLQGRVRFVGAPQAAKFGSMLVYFRAKIL